MILQADKFSCGAAALVNVLRALGRDLPVAALAKLAGTNPVRGTTDAGIRRALRRLDYRVRKLEVVGSSSQAVAALRGYLVSGSPAVLSVDGDEHWAAAVGVVGDRVLLADSAHSDLVLSLTPAELARRWRAHPGEHDVYTGVVVLG